MKKLLTTLFVACFFLGAGFAQKLYFPSNAQSTFVDKAYEDAVFALLNAEHQKFESRMAEVIKAEPDNFMAHVHLALHAFHVKKMDLFEKHAKRALDLAPREEASRHLVNILKMRLEDSDADVSQEAALLIHSSRDVLEAHLLAAMLHFELNNPWIAYEGLFVARRMAPDFAPIYNSLGYAAMMVDQMDKAGEFFAKYLELMPENANAHDSMGDYYLQKGEYAKAAEFFEKAYNLDKTFTFSREKAVEARQKMK